MKIGIIGATGGTGMALVEQALGRGHEVRALVRTPAKLGRFEHHEGVSVLTGDVLEDADAVRACVEGCDAVVVSLGGKSEKTKTVRTDGTAVIVSAMKDVAPEARIVIVSSMGANESNTIAELGVAGYTFVNTVIKSAIDDHSAQEHLVRDSGLSHTLVRPGGLTDGPGVGAPRTDGKGAGRIARADVALGILDLLEQDTHVDAAIIFRSA